MGECIEAEHGCEWLIQAKASPDPTGMAPHCSQLKLPYCGALRPPYVSLYVDGVHQLLDKQALRLRTFRRAA